MSKFNKNTVDRRRCQKNYASWLAVDKGIAKISRLTFFGPPCIYYTMIKRFCGRHIIIHVMYSSQKYKK